MSEGLSGRFGCSRFSAKCERGEEALLWWIGSHASIPDGRIPILYMRLDLVVRRQWWGLAKGIKSIMTCFSPRAQLWKLPPANGLIPSAATGKEMLQFILDKIIATKHCSYRLLTAYTQFTSPRSCKDASFPMLLSRLPRLARQAVKCPARTPRQSATRQR